MCWKLGYEVNMYVMPQSCPLSEVTQSRNKWQRRCSPCYKTMVNDVPSPSFWSSWLLPMNIDRCSFQKVPCEVAYLSHQNKLCVNQQLSIPKWWGKADFFTILKLLYLFTVIFLLLNIGASVCLLGNVCVFCTWTKSKQKGGPLLTALPCSATTGQKLKLLSLPAHQIKQLFQWPSASKYEALPTPLVTVLDSKGSMFKLAIIAYMQCLVRLSK